MCVVLQVLQSGAGTVFQDHHGREHARSQRAESRQGVPCAVHLAEGAHARQQMPRRPHPQSQDPLLPRTGQVRRGTPTLQS